MSQGVDVTRSRCHKELAVGVSNKATSLCRIGLSSGEVQLQAVSRQVTNALDGHAAHFASHERLTSRSCRDSY
jgi:hypothetical protein